MLESSCGVKSRSRAAASCAIAPSSAGAAWSAVANAHAVLVSSCGLNSRSDRCAASVAIASSSAGAAWSAVAYAHAVLERACGANSRSPRCTASSAIASSSAGSRRPIFANPCTVVDKCCASILGTRLVQYFASPANNASPALQPADACRLPKPLTVFASGRASNLGSACSVCSASGCSIAGDAPRSSRLSLGWRTNFPSVFHEAPRSLGPYRLPYSACASTTCRTVRSSPIRGTLDRLRQLGQQPSRARRLRSSMRRQLERVPSQPKLARGGKRTTERAKDPRPRGTRSLNLSEQRVAALRCTLNSQQNSIPDCNTPPSLNALRAQRPRPQLRADPPGPRPHPDPHPVRACCGGRRDEPRHPTHQRPPLSPRGRHLQAEGCRCSRWAERDDVGRARDIRRLPDVGVALRKGEPHHHLL
eukprot:scaffold18492_cov72-Phaeocystis_antarctica.AAC.1